MMNSYDEQQLKEKIASLKEQNENILNKKNVI